MRKFITALLIAIWLLFIYIPVKIKAAIVFSDSFQGGYDQSVWRLDSNSSIPVASLFGIGGEDITSTYTLWSKTSPPLDAIIKVDLKINSIPSHTLLGCKGIDGGNENRVIFYGVNDIPPDLIGTWKLASFENGSGTGGSSGYWDMTPGIHHLELNCISNIMTVKEDGNTLGYWDVTGHNNFISTTGRFQYWFGDSEYANYQLCDGNGCEGPTPPPTTKAVVVPGFLASWNTAALLSCSLDDNYGPWELMPLAQPIYQPVMDALTSAGLTPELFPYDWRKHVLTNANLLSAKIENGLVAGEKKDLIGHSMGGLLGRAYLEELASNNRIEKMMTVGTPHKGVVKAYPSWSGGEIWEDDIFKRIAFTTILKACGLVNGQNDREVIQTLIPSVQDLLPTFDYLYDQASGLPNPVEFAQNLWLMGSTFGSPFENVVMGALSGNSFKTLSAINVKDRNRRDEMLDNWADGKPLSNGYSIDGDNTVLTMSGELTGADNRTIDQDHFNLIASSEGVSEILDFLGVGGASLETSIYTLPTSALVVISHPANLAVYDPSGELFKDTQGMVAIANPLKGAYRFLLFPKTSQTRFIVAQFLSDGRTLWKEYKHNSILPKIGSLTFDPANPLEDILK